MGSILAPASSPTSNPISFRRNDDKEERTMLIAERLCDSLRGASERDSTSDESVMTNMCGDGGRAALDNVE